jgi:hypothetical protein
MVRTRVASKAKAREFLRCAEARRQLLSREHTLVEQCLDRMIFPFSTVKYFADSTLGTGRGV